MSHLGFKILYEILNDDPRTLAERCYAPWVDMEARAPRARRCRSSRSRARARSATSTSSASRCSSSSRTRTSCTMLDLGGIPLRAASAARTIRSSSRAGRRRRTPSRSRRSSTRSSSATARRSATEVALAWTRAASSAGVPRARAPRRARAARRRLRAVALRDASSTPTPGFEVVDAAARRRAAAARSSARSSPISTQYPVPRRRPGRRTRGDLRSHVDRDRARLHRGLPLLPGGHDLPARCASAIPEQIVDTVARRRCEKRGYDEVSLTALSTADYSCISPLVKKVDGRSSRRGASCARRLVAARLRPRRGAARRDPKVRATGLTFAPEAGTQRMRDVVNKNVTEEQLHRDRRARVLARLVAR